MTKEGRHNNALRRRAYTLRSREVRFLYLLFPTCFRVFVPPYCNTNLGLWWLLSWNTEQRCFKAASPKFVTAHLKIC